MAMHATPFSGSEKIFNRIKASPQKSAVLCGLAVVLAILWGRMLLGTRAPSAAQAGAAGLPIITPPNDLAVPGHPTEHGTLLLQWARQQVVPMRRNLFSVPFDYYPSEQAHAADAPASDGFWGLLAKSMSLQADQQVQRQAMIDEIQTNARSLQLQSTMLGATPSAMVDGQMVREGSIVAGFRVLKIEARRMVVEREGIKLEIFMN
jgi:hypothetical protein